MFTNYLKIARRNLFRNKLYSAINILGLATGMAVALLAGLWIWDEISFDHYFPHHSRVMHQWLLNYEYRTEISWWVFVMAGMSAVLVTLLTVSYQSIRSALMNPVKSLRIE